jgi:hypothetical protein
MRIWVKPMGIWQLMMLKNRYNDSYIDGYNDGYKL